MSFECKYDLHEDLGKGMFGVVKKCRDKETGQVFAAKIVRKTKKTTEDALREISMMKLLKHEGLAQIYESFVTQRQIIIVMEFIPGKELFAKVTEDEVFSEKTAVMYLKQMLLGIQHMHSKYIVHLDIKPENIICKPGTQPGTEDVKLIDFGLAREVRPGYDVTVLCGTPEFVAPEVLSYDPVSLASDMWSIGVITYVLLSGISPFLGDNDAETLGYVTCGEYDFDNHAEVFDNVSEDAKSFIEQLLEVNPRDRNSVNDCLCHSWITTGGGENLLTTSNLKTFNAKRKWQKTLNAVRAVGRFAFLNRVKNLKETLDISELKKDTPENKKETEELNKPLSEVEGTTNEYLHLPEESSKETSSSTGLPLSIETEAKSSEVLTEAESSNPCDPQISIDSEEKQSTTENIDLLESTCTDSNISETSCEDRFSSQSFTETESSNSPELKVESTSYSDLSVNLTLRLKALSNKQFDLDEDFQFSRTRSFNRCFEPHTNSYSEKENTNIMESNNDETHSNQNGNETLNGIEEDEEAKDDVSPLETPANGLVENGEDPDVKVAFKNWYRRASTSKTLTSVQQKNIEKGMENDIPTFCGDSQNGIDTPKNGSNGGNTPKQPEISEEEQKVLDAISRRLSINTSSDSLSGKQDPKSTKPKLSGIRRGSVPQARSLKGNVKNRLKAFENK